MTRRRDRSATLLQPSKMIAMDKVSLVVLLLVLTSALLSVSSASSSSSSTKSNTRTHQEHPAIVPTNNNNNRLNCRRRLLLLLDVDNTLYDDRTYKIENQIVTNIHNFCCSSYLNKLINMTMTVVDADELHYKYGSTIDGIRQTMFTNKKNNDEISEAEQKQQRQRHEQEKELCRNFYDQIYNTVDVTSLLVGGSGGGGCNGNNNDNGETSTMTSTTGYTHHDYHNGGGGGQQGQAAAAAISSSMKEQDQIRKMLLSIASSPKSSSSSSMIYLTSNSPRKHIAKVVQGMGLARIPWAGIRTPDSKLDLLDDRDDSAAIERDDDHEDYNSNRGTSRTKDAAAMLYPTKANPRDFFGRHLLSLLSSSSSSEGKDEQQRRHEWFGLSSTKQTAASTTATATTIMIDDSIRALEACNKWVDCSIRISYDYDNGDSGASSSSAPPRPVGITSALSMATGWIPYYVILDDEIPKKKKNTKTNTNGNKNNEYTFSQIEYLKCKNRIDMESLDRTTYQQLIDELSSNLLAVQRRENQQQTQAQQKIIRIVDVGAGLLSMLRLFMLGHKSQNISDNNNDLPPLFDSIVMKLGRGNQNHYDVEYYAYEPNRDLEYECLDILENELGFELDRMCQWEKNSNGNHIYYPEHVFVKQYNININNKIVEIRVKVHLRLWDYRRKIMQLQQEDQEPPPHLIVGCCFADLYEPRALIRSLMYHFLSSPSSMEPSNNHTCINQTLLYFPITFKGITQFVPSQPVMTASTKRTRIPSDTAALAMYSKALASEHHGHYLNPLDLVEAVQDYGGRRLACGVSSSASLRTRANAESLLSLSSSDWIIDPIQHPYMWNTMIYFFGTVACPEICSCYNDYDAAREWIERVKMKKPKIIASNTDLLFSLPHLGEWDFLNENGDHDDTSSNKKKKKSILSYKEIQFEAPYQVGAVTKTLDMSDKGRALKPNEVLIESVCSLVSSGTELKVYKGQFEDDAALDVNIKGMEEERMAYPLSYGYSLVGRVIACGDGSSGGDDEDLVGKLVFAFAPHATHVVVDRTALHLVPDGIDPLDAIFMPSVETALSIVHDASPRLGENTVVFGQGLIGLLVTALLSLNTASSDSSSNDIVATTTVDTIPTRLAVSAMMGSTQALFPSEVEKAGPFDVAIEISGNGKALQLAIDKTRMGGRIVIGSWYGSNDISLKLGIDFHRSHKTIITSQVSEISAPLRGTWTKERRFDLTWKLVKCLRPSRHLLTRICSLNDAQLAYNALDQGDEIAVAFEYNR